MALQTAHHLLHAILLLITLGVCCGSVCVRACSFQNHQIFPGSKITHFNRIRKQTQLAFEDMIFFDDGTIIALASRARNSPPTLIALRAAQKGGT